MDAPKIIVVTIYELIDPVTLRCRYVGQSTKPRTRLAYHMWVARSRRGKTRIYTWIRRTIADGAEPILRVIEECDVSRADEREIHWIAQRRSEGCDLTNHTDGGGGLRGHRHTDEVKARIGRAHAGKFVSEETRKRISACRLGTISSKETRAKISAYQQSNPRVIDKDERAAISARMMGNQHSKGKTQSREVIERRAVNVRGENSATASVTSAQAVEIRRLAANGMKQIRIAEQFGLTTATVCRIVKRRTYKNC